MNEKSEKKYGDINSLLEIFEEHVSVSDITASRYLGKISAAIVKKRVAMNMTQKEFAEHIKVSQGMISKWESGDYNFSVKTLAEVAEKLDMELYINLKTEAEREIKKVSEGNKMYFIYSSEENKKTSNRYNMYNAGNNNLKFIEKKIYNMNEKYEAVRM